MQQFTKKSIDKTKEGNIFYNSYRTRTTKLKLIASYSSISNSITYQQKESVLQYLQGRAATLDVVAFRLGIHREVLNLILRELITEGKIFRAFRDKCVITHNLSSYYSASESIISIFKAAS